MSTARLLTDLTNVRFRRVYNKNDILVKAMLAAGLEEYITSGFIVEELPNGIRGNRVYLQELNLAPNQSRASPQPKAINSRRGSQFEQILEELHQMEKNSRRNAPMTFMDKKS